MLTWSSTDDNVVASIDFSSGKFADSANKISWQQVGSDASIEADSKFGYAFRGNKSCWWKADVSSIFTSDKALTVESWIYIDEQTYSKRAGIWSSCIKEIDEGNVTSDDVGIEFTGYNCLRFARPNLLVYEGTLPMNAWHHVACTISADHRQYRFFVDGKKAAETTSNYPALPRYMRIMKGYYDGVLEGNCKVANVRISDIVRYSTDFDCNKLMTEKETGGR